jgi:hypothetical protein
MSGGDVDYAAIALCAGKIDGSDYRRFEASGSILYATGVSF